MKQSRKRRKSTTDSLLRDQSFVAVAIASVLFLFVSWEIRALIISLAIIAIALYYRRFLLQQEMLRETGIEAIDSMTGVAFEQRLWRLFTDMGYSVETTAASGDFGADLVLRKDGDITVVQAKRYSSAVGVTAIQEVTAARAHYGANHAMVVTNAPFSSAAEKLAYSNNIELWDRKRLIKELSREIRKTKRA